MIDSYQQLTRSNRIYTIIKNFETTFPDEFEKCGIKKCGHCGNSGFSNVHQMNPCAHCGGMGYFGFEKIEGEFVCRSCNGFGCRKCNQSGTVDWVTHASGSDILKGKYL